MSLDPAQDPDRFDPTREPEPVGKLDPALDPDRFGAGSTLPELLGAGSQEEERDNLSWLVGLVTVIGFLLLVSLLLQLG